jgi:hypothetical protein
MHIAARLAMQNCGEARTGSGPVSFVPHSPAAAYHGRNIVIRSLSEQGFEADSVDDYPIGALVRLRLPGAGAVLARVTDVADGQVKGSFVNPVGSGRLAMAVGTRPAAFA